MTAKETPFQSNRKLYVLNGGTEAWCDAGFGLVKGDDPDAEELSDDVWYKPYEREDAIEDSMRDYLTWEVGLVEQLQRDGTTRFKRFDSVCLS